MKRLSITQLVPGMTVAEDVYDLDHELLIQKGTILTDKLITKLDPVSYTHLTLPTNREV